MKESEGTGDRGVRVNPEQEIMSVCLAVVRGLITPDEARAAILARTSPAPLGDTLRLGPDIAREVAELSRLPEKDREQCLELFRELWDSTPGAQLIQEDETLGRMLVEQHVVTGRHVEECREIQKRLLEAECHPLPRLGELLVRKGFLLPGETDQAQTQRVKKGDSASAPGSPGHPPRRLPEGVEKALSDPAHQFGRYVRVSLLGSGGAGEVWKAWDTVLERWVAVKFLRFEDTEELARLRREAQMAARLSHPNIAAVFEIADASERTFLVMEFIEGQTLETWPRTNHRHLVALMRQICRAIQYAHDQGIIHRDIKPGNIMVDATGRAFLMDFGLARQIDSERSMNGHVLGTPSYMSPEQAMGGVVDARSDGYSLGATLYELLSGRPPFRGKNVLDTLDQVVREEPPPLTRISEDLRTIVAKCLMKEPARRYRTAADISDELGRWEEGEAIIAHPPSVLYRLSKKIAKRKSVLAAGLGGIVVAAIVAGWVVPRWLRADRGELQLGQELAAERASRAVEAKALESARTHLDQGRKLRVLLDRALMSEGGSPENARSLIEQAQREVDRALEVYPNYPEALLEKSWTFMGERNPPRALEYCTRAIEARPGYTLAYLTRARILLDGFEGKRRAGGAPSSEAKALGARIRDDLKKVQATSKDTLEISFADGAMALVAGEYEKAARILEEYSQGSVSDYRGWEWTGGAWLRVPGMAEKAVRAFTEALKYRPRQASLWSARGEARVQDARQNRQNREQAKGEQALAQALADFRRAVELDPSDLPSQVSLGEALLLTGDPGLALSTLSKAIEQSPGSPLPHLARAWARLRCQDGDGALADAEEALRLGSADPAAKVVRGRARCMEGDVGGARSDFEEALAKDPSQARALVGLGDVQRERGHPSDALVDYGRALDLDPGLGEAYQHRGAAKRDQGQWDKAIQDLTNAIEIDPSDPLLYYDRGVTHCNRGAWSDAEADFRKGLALGPLKPERFWHRLWLVRARQGDAVPAREGLAKLLTERTATPASKFLWRISDFLAGALSEKDFLEALERTEFSRKAIAEGYFFAGEKALVEGRASPAAELFQRCLKTGALTAPGYSTAEAELKRIAAPH